MMYEAAENRGNPGDRESLLTTSIGWSNLAYLLAQKIPPLFSGHSQTLFRAACAIPRYLAQIEDDRLSSLEQAITDVEACHETVEAGAKNGWFLEFETNAAREILDSMKQLLMRRRRHLMGG